LPDCRNVINSENAVYKRILVAIDGSKTSASGLRHAIKLAAEAIARMRLVHVVDSVPMDIEVAAAEMELWKALRKSGESLLKRAEQRAGRAGLESETKLLEVESFGERVADVIVQDAKRWHADLIVIGTHGRSGVSHAVFGSVAEGVVRSSTTPVLLIRGPRRNTRKRRPRSRI
jgi:nucleotide-binding universal stress UspA family protein